MAARGWRLLLGLSVGAAIPRFFGGILRMVRRIFGQQTKMSFPHYLPKKSKRGARLVVFSMFSCLFDVILSLSPYHIHPETPSSETQVSASDVADNSRTFPCAK